ncbi:hypothetical protein GH714_032053 [Hevea brasiliensis]|uniref:NFACT RNA-binding domain-containing protein n=1 Tax=Hevea brasiliensis TaxID=3981 RepID=A0A6A6LSQ9_HEVBR|nr:hypothetical protein GH714_032053 [Hevea brasiliensis]
MLSFNFLLAFVLVSAERGLKREFARVPETEEGLSSYFLKAADFLWQPDESGYQHVWPEMKFGWQIVLGTIIGFFGAAFGSVGGVGGGGIFVPMLSLIIGMIMGAAASTVYYNLKLRHPTIDMPIIDYDLTLLIQPMLMLGISIGVAFNVIFADWMVTILLIILFMGTSTKAFFKGVETWKKETIMKQEAAKRLETNGTGGAEVEYKPLPSGPNSGPEKDTKEAEVTILENVYWKELGLLVFVWVAFLVLQIAKNHTSACSTEYWIVNLLQIPVSVGVTLYEAVSLYKGRRIIASKGEDGTNFKVHQLVLYSACGVLAGVVGGLLGLGGGFIMGPLFLELGIPPQVSSATATFAMTFSSSMSVVEYYLLKRFPVPYALYFVAVATLAALIGQHIVRRLIIVFGRASLIIFILAFTIFVSAISLARPEVGDYTIFMGLDKYENEELIKYGFPEDIWFHVDKMSSAHVYLRLHKGQTIDDISEGLLEDCAQLVKANSIQGNKVNNIDVVYTPWSNLKKTASMDVGQVGFHNPKMVRTVRVEKRINEIVNRLNRTKVERRPDLKAEREAVNAAERAERKLQLRDKKRREEMERLEKERQAEIRSYKGLMVSEKMTSNKQIAAENKSLQELEEDFIGGSIGSDVIGGVGDGLGDKEFGFGWGLRHGVVGVGHGRDGVVVGGRGIVLVSSPKIPACVMEVRLLRRIRNGMGGLSGKAHEYLY